MTLNAGLELHFNLHSCFCFQMWDVGKGFKIPEVYHSGYIVIALSIFTSVALTALWTWCSNEEESVQKRMWETEGEWHGFCLWLSLDAPCGPDSLIKEISKLRNIYTWAVVCFCLYLNNALFKVVIYLFITHPVIRYGHRIASHIMKLLFL